MSVLERVVDSDVSDEGVASWQRQQAEKAVKAEWVTKELGKAFRKVEERDKTCHWLCMNAADYVVMRKYLYDDLDVITEASLLKTGRMANYLTAVIVVNRSVETPVGYGEDELPDGMLQK